VENLEERSVVISLLASMFPSPCPGKNVSGKKTGFGIEIRPLGLAGQAFLPFVRAITQLSRYPHCDGAAQVAETNVHLLL
jgi:hypothetical protein